ncbi:hypothetical protein PInf_005173 [Phytophthora infestans]|nr:hypothetical protein PInf_005173 [Phytophthora infestans]
MVKLICAIVVDEGKTVDDLKKAIKAKKANDFKKVNAAKLQLVLAKKDESRVTKGVIDTTGLKLLEAARARLRRVGLSDKDVGGVDEDEEVEGSGPVNVLVKGPDGSIELALSPPANSVALQHIAWYGTRGSIVSGEGIDRDDPRTRSRATFTTEIIHRPEQRYTMDNKQMVVFNFSALSTHKNKTFEDNFKKHQAEVFEYVQLWFKGITCFEGLPSEVQEFCANLEKVAPLSTIFELNRIYGSRRRSASRQPLPAEWIRMLQRWITV